MGSERPAKYRSEIQQTSRTSSTESTASFGEILAEIDQENAKPYRKNYFTEDLSLAAWLEISTRRSERNYHSTLQSKHKSDQSNSTVEAGHELIPRPNNNIDPDDESEEEFKQSLTTHFQQMMFVSGELGESSAETMWMIEEIVREQVVEMLVNASILANRRGSKSISIMDLIFQIRHNQAKVSRLKTFLSWKDVRKNVKDSDDKAGGDAGDTMEFDDNVAGNQSGGPQQKAAANKKGKLVLPWETQSFYSEQVPEREDEEEDEEEEEQNEATLARLASADERTKNMTREEYEVWSECRQASFTFRKGKRFREWAGFGTVIESKPNDDVIDILGFLTFDIVQTLTEEALKVKVVEDLHNKKTNSGRGDNNENNKRRKREGGCSLFEMHEEERTPIEPKHVREAFRRLQVIPNKYKFMRPGYAGMRTQLRLI